MSDVELPQSEKPRKPSTPDDDQKQTDALLYRKLLRILNQLTPQTFRTLIKRVQGLVIDTETRLKGVTDIIFEKAIREPAFSETYANLCRYLASLKAPSDTKPGESVNFRVILLTRCQQEFEKNTLMDLEKRKQDIKQATDKTRTAELKELEDAITRERVRTVGNIRFVGELFKVKMLTETIMHDCIFRLLRSQHEVKLEGMCQLLTLIGKELESEKATPRIDQYFQQIKKLAAEKKFSPRCRTVLQEVIDLRDNSWKPRGDEEKSLEQNKLTTHTVQQSSPSKDRQSKHNKPARGRPGGQAGGAMEEGLNSSKAIHKADRNIEHSKLRKEKSTDENIQLGPARSFGGWGRGSSGGGSRASQEGEKPKAPGNRFSSLSKEDAQISYAFGQGDSPTRGETARGRPGGQAGGAMEEGWNTVSSKAIRNIDRNIDVSKLRIEKKLEFTAGEIGEAIPPHETSTNKGIHN